MDRRRNDSGAVAVEFGLLAPVLFLIILAIIDFGFIFNAKIGVTQAAREGVRVVALGDPSGAAGRVAQTLSSNGGLTAATNVIQDCSGGSDVARVGVTAVMPTILPVPDVTLAAEGVMRCNG